MFINDCSLAKKVDIFVLEAFLESDLFVATQRDSNWYSIIFVNRDLAC